jgi:hypothetical protein
MAPGNESYTYRYGLLKHGQQNLYMDLTNVKIKENGITHRI